MTQSIVVHHLEKSRSHRALWLLEELDLPYELVVHKRHPETIRAPAELRKVHPLGKAPILVVDGEATAESGAILERGVELGDGKLAPEPGTAAYRRYTYWMHYAEGSMMPPLLVRLIFTTVRNAPLPFFIKPVVKGIVKKVEGSYTKPELERHGAYVEAHLSEHAFFAGDAFSAADIQMSYPIEALLARGKVSAPMPKTQAWLDNMKARDGYRRALEKGGPVML